MLNFIVNWKLYALTILLIISLSCAGVLNYKLSKAESAIQACNADKLYMQSIAQQEYNQRLIDSRKKEHEANDSINESQKNADETMNGKVDNVNHYLIERAVNFKWHNTIP